MGLPPANTVLFFLAAFTALWGASVILRARRAQTIPGARRCPECKADMRQTPLRTCPACAYEAPTATALQIRRHDLRSLLVGIVSTAGGIALAPAALWVRRWETTGNDETLSIHPLSAAFYGVAAFGLALAVWAYRGDRSKGRRRCPKCWYDMSATIARDAPSAAPLTCPECGHEPTSIRALYRPRRRRRLALLGLAVIVAGLYGQTVPRALRTGPLGLVPTTVLIAGMPWLPESWYVDPAGTSDATLEERADWDRIWEWQLRWGRAAILSDIRRDPLRANGAAAQVLLDNGSSEIRADVSIALAHRLGEPGVRVSPEDAKAILNHLGNFIWTQDDDPDECLAAIDQAVRDNAAALLRRAEQGAEDEAALSLALIAIPREPLEGAFDAIMAGISNGTNTRVWTAAWQLGRRAATDPTLLPVIRELIFTGTAQERRAGRVALSVAQQAGTNDGLLALTLEVVFGSDDPQVVFNLAGDLAYAYHESDLVQSEVRSRELPPAAAFAYVWMYDDDIESADALPKLLPAIHSDDAFQVASFVDFCLARSPLGPDLTETVLGQTGSILTSKDPTIRAEGVRLLMGLAQKEPALEDRVLTLLRDHSLTAEDYLTPDFSEVRNDLPLE